MTIHFYLLPIEHNTDGKYRGPKYLRWRYNPSGIDCRWSLKDFGSDIEIGLVATDAPIHHKDALRIKDSGRSAKANLASYLRSVGVESDWIRKAQDSHDLLQRLAGVALTMQAGKGDPSYWQSQPIYFGFAQLGIYDLDAHHKERQRIAELARHENKRLSSFPIVFKDNHPFWKLGNIFLPVISGGALPATDNFTGSDWAALTTYSANWVATFPGDYFTIMSNAVTWASSQDGVAHWGADEFNDNQYSQAVCTTFVASKYIGVAVRAETTETAYFFYANATDSYIYKIVNGGVRTQIGNAGGAFTNGDTIRLEANTTTLTPKRNGATSDIGAQTDNSIASGHAGLSAFGGTYDERLDTWEGGDLGEAPVIKSLTDTGAGSDNVSVTATEAILKSLTDSGFSVDSVTTQANIPVIDSGFGISPPNIYVILTGLDTGYGSDNVSVSAAPEVISGSTVWGHSTGVLETNIRTFAGNWTGTGSITGAGDDEKIALDTSQYMISEVVNTGVSATITLLQNEYSSGDTVTLQYRHGATQVACEAASWNDYTVSFESLGYVQVRVSV